MINPKYYKTLELDKILNMLAEYTCCDYAKQRVLSITPSTNIRIVTDELQKTDDAFTLSCKYGTPSFIRFFDPSEALKNARIGGVLNTKQLINIKEILTQIRILVDFEKTCKEKNTSISEIFSLLIPNKALEDRIAKVIISEDEIDDYASDALANIRKKIRSKMSAVKDNLDKMIRSSTTQKALQENIITMRNGRYVLSVKSEYKGAINGLVHDTSASGSTLFIEPMVVVELNNEVRVALAEEKAEIERILAELSAQCGECCDNIIDNFETIISLNIYFAKSHLAAKMKASKPTIVNDGRILLNKARHPLIDPKKVVPINVEIGNENTTLLITGPNTGGKTVTLKTVGLFSLMSMCGILIPALDGSIISIFENILVDIGDEQSIEQSLSTFSSHMTNIISILNVATSNSLILLDELGSGTDPIEGASLAMAILEKLKSKGAIILATTHYPELKVYALTTEKVINACCEFDIKTLMPTYKLLVGVPGRSNAFEISRKLGLQEDILKTATEYIDSDKKNFEDVIESLEKSREEYEINTVALQEKTEELEKLKSKINEDISVTLDKRDSIINKANAKAQAILDDVRLQSELLLKELDEIRKAKSRENFSQMANDARSSLKNKINKLYDSANPVTDSKSNQDYELPRPLKVGDSVLIVDIDKKGIVLEISGKNILVQSGIIKTRVTVDNLRLLNEKKTTVTGHTTRTVTNKKDVKASMELDLRGQNAEEAIMDLDMYINKSILLNIGQFTVIHGKGTGVLRAAVHQFLKRHNSVKSYRLGVFGEGETGVTLVELK